MDVEKLIEQLNNWNEKYISNLCGDRTIKCEEYCIKDDCLIVKAAIALSTLQAENEEMQKHLNEFSEFLCHMTGGLLSKTNYTAQEMISAAEDYQQNVCGECDLRAESEKLRAELEQVKAERDAAVESIPHECKTCVYHTVFFNGCTPDHDCTNPDGGCSNNCDRWKWRGRKEG